MVESTELEKSGGVIRKEVSEITLKILLYFFFPVDCRYSCYCGSWLENPLENDRKLL